MIGFDTNVIVRYLTQDDPVQSPKATELIERGLTEEEPGFVSVVTMAETAWVLERVYGRTAEGGQAKFQFGMLSEELGLPAPTTGSEWEEQVRANVERGWPADWIDRKYIPPDWSKVYPLIGGPPVRTTTAPVDGTVILRSGRQS